MPSIKGKITNIFPDKRKLTVIVSDHIESVAVQFLGKYLKRTEGIEPNDYVEVIYRRRASVSKTNTIYNNSIGIEIQKLT
jgi:hypothetical protein